MTDKERSQAIVDYASKHVGGPYIMGATAEKCTPKYRRSLAEGRSKDYADKITDNCPVLSGKQDDCDGCKWQGMIAHDCAQLTRHAAEAAGLSLPSGATSQWQDGDWAAKGLIATLPRGYVCILYHRKNGSDSVMSHTGVYIGDGLTIDSRGHKDGTVLSRVDDYPWTHWAILRGMERPEGLPLIKDRKTVRQGSRNNDVRELQRLLRVVGYDLEIDGRFGQLTKEAVLSFQGSEGLERDGVVGPMTWAALDAAAEGGRIRYTVTIPGLTEAVARQIIQEHGGRMEVSENE